MNPIENDGAGHLIIRRRVLGLSLVPWCDIGIDPIESLVRKNDGLVQVKRDWYNGELPSGKRMTGSGRVFGVGPY